MPGAAWNVRRHTRAANTPKRRRQWRHVADSMVRRGYSERRAIMAADAVVRRAHRGSRRRA